MIYNTTKFKQILSLLLAFVLFLSALPFTGEASAANFSGSTWEYSYDKLLKTSVLVPDVYEVTSQTTISTGTNFASKVVDKAYPGEFITGKISGKWLVTNNASGKALYVPANKLTLHKHNYNTLEAVYDNNHQLYSCRCGYVKLNSTELDAITLVKQLAVGGGSVEAVAITAGVCSIPGVGTFCDVRDLTVDFVKLLNGDASIGDIALDVACFLPVVSVAKYADEARAIKHLSDKEVGNLLTDTYKNLRKIYKGTGVEVHHLMEKRFASLFDVPADEFLSLPISKAAHRKITNDFRKGIAYGTIYDNVSYNDLRNCVIEVYKDDPAILNATLEWMDAHWKGVK